MSVTVYYPLYYKCNLCYQTTWVLNDFSFRPLLSMYYFIGATYKIHNNSLFFENLLIRYFPCIWLIFNKFPGEGHRNLNILIQSNEVMPRRAFGFDIYSCPSSGSCWVWGIPPEVCPETGHTVTVSESAGSEVLKSLTPVENSRLLRTQQTGTSSPSTTSPQRTAWISELTQKRVPRLELS